MILRSIRVQGWRCFADPLEVGPLADGLNVLHAPNATGKSTLFEALLRGLLDGHRVSGRDVDALRPWGRELAPTVTVEFARGGVEHRLTKRFLDRPSSELARREGGRFVRVAEGDGADERAREILTRNPPGRGLARQENWGLAQVLWAPQGTLALAGLSGDVVADIRASLGVQVSGPGSGPLEDRIEEAYGRIFTPGGKLRTGKDAPPLVRLKENLQAAMEARGAALAQQQAYEEAARKVEDLRAQRAQARRDAEAITKALAEARVRADTYKSLVSEAGQRQAKAKAAEAQYNELKQRIDAIGAAEKELAGVREILGRLQGEAPLRAREVEEREKAEATGRKALEDARRGREAVDAADEQARQADHYVRARHDLAALEDRLRRIGEANTTLAKRKKERAALVAPDDKALRAIRKAIKDRDDAQVRLEAALITLEVVPEKDGSLAVIAGEETGTYALKAGVPAQVKGSPEVVVDLVGLARIRARGPSGPEADLRAERDKAAQRLAALTEGFGTREIEALEALHAKARALDDAIAKAETQLETFLEGETLEKIEGERGRLAARCEEIVKRYPAWHDTPPDAEAIAAEARDIRRKFIAAVEGAEAAWQAAQKALTAAREQSAGFGAQLKETDRQAKIIEGRLADLTADGKPMAERQSDLGRFAMVWDAARASLGEIEKALAAFGGDPAEAVTRLERQLQAAAEAATKAMESEKHEEGRLANLAALGTYSALVRAEEEVARLQQELAAEEVRVAAIRLLHDTVAQCRAEVLEAVATPIEAAATRTLERIAGGRLGRLRLGEGFAPEQMAPELAGGPVPIESASGGEREQIYLATRLALAEVLAKDERQLVVLDDVLTATDTGRLARIMAILEEAAQRLQVLILTCHPERYGGLGGAKFFDLDAILRASPL